MNANTGNDTQTLTEKEQSIINALRSRDLLGFLNVVLDVSPFDSDKARAQSAELKTALFWSKAEKVELRRRVAEKLAAVVFGALVKERYVSLADNFLAEEAPSMYREIVTALEDGLDNADHIEFERLFS
jgi:hypothetical protein